MRNQKVFRLLLAVVLAAAVGLSCNLISNLQDAQEAIEMKNTIEVLVTDMDVGVISTDVGALVTQVDMGAIETQMESMATELGGGGVVETMGAAFTEMPGFSGEKPADIPVMEGGDEMLASSDLVEYFIDKGFQEVMDFYEREMPANGWVRVEGSVETDYAKLVFEKAGRKATIEISTLPFLEQTSVSIYIEGE
ncbi:MAG: hypothetical protein JXA78_12685 [Anaerolineales bacterium]|nr:hypothetical protein [Anaerolineales bacterium]